MDKTPPEITQHSLSFCCAVLGLPLGTASVPDFGPCLVNPLSNPQAIRLPALSTSARPSLLFRGLPVRMTCSRPACLLLPATADLERGRPGSPSRAGAFSLFPYFFSFIEMINKLIYMVFQAACVLLSFFKSMILSTRVSISSANSWFFQD